MNRKKSFTFSGAENGVNGSLPSEEAKNPILNGRSNGFFGIGIRRGRRGRIVAVKLLGDLIEQRFVGGAGGDGALRFLRHWAANFSDRKKP